MFKQFLRKFLTPSSSANQAAQVVIPEEIKFKIVIVDFYDRSNSDGAKNLTDLLTAAQGLEVSCLSPDFNLSFLNFESRNFFDLIERGQYILKQTKADVLIWGYRQDDYIRLNFQTADQYQDNEDSFVGLLDCMYIPAANLNNEGTLSRALLDLLIGTIIAAVNCNNSEARIYKKFLLKKIIGRLSQIDSAKSLGLEHMPYIMNQLGLIYMSVAAANGNEADFKTISNLFETALKYQKQILDPTHLGCIYLHMGQLNDCASIYMKKRLSFYFRSAIYNYQMAQKYFGKYTYPYDHGHICYKLSGLYYNYWKQSEDLQALRDSVSQLRECEKIFSQAQFPDFWGRIQGNLGYLLHNLAHITKNTEICRVAVNAYKNEQKVFTENRQPLFWAQIQQKIAEIYYLEGKLSDNSEALEEALSCFHDALYIFETSKKETAVIQANNLIAKTRQLLGELKDKEDEMEDFIQP